MLTVLSYVGAFAAGFIGCDLVRIAQEHRALRYITHAMNRRSEPVDAVVSGWAADPHNWCDKPGCPRCWGDGGRS